MHFSDVKENSRKNKFIPYLLMLVNTVILNQSINQSIKAKLFLPIIPIGTVAYAFTRQLSKQLYTLTSRLHRSGVFVYKHNA